MSAVSKIVLVDDHQMILDGLTALITGLENCDVIQQFNNAESAFDFILENDVDVLVTDISMPGMNGLELTKKVKNFNPSIKVLVLSMHNDKAIINDILISEAEGFVLKDSTSKELKKAIERIVGGGTHYSPKVLENLVNHVRKELKDEIGWSVLSEREIEIVKLIVQEFSTAQIAEKLFISPRTVETHRRNIMSKTESKTLVGLIKFALEHDILNK